MARRILVVEDEAPIREMVCFVLEQNGFQPVEAEDYDSAVNQLNEPWPDLILLDWMLPGGSGLQFIKLLQARGDDAGYSGSDADRAWRRRGSRSRPGDRRG